MAGSNVLLDQHLHGREHLNRHATVTRPSDNQPFMSAQEDSVVTGWMLIGGKPVESSGGYWIECINPANEDYIGKVSRGTTPDVEQAVRAAKVRQSLGRSFRHHILP